MPSDQEKLAIAEEAWSVSAPARWMRAGFEVAEYDKGIIHVRQPGGGELGAFPAVGKTVFLSLIEAIYAARQKLAAEREAARTPEERRLREALQNVGNSITWAEAVGYALKALEQGAAQ